MKLFIKFENSQILYIHVLLIYFEKNVKGTNG